MAGLNATPNAACQRAASGQPPSASGRNACSPGITRYAGYFFLSPPPPRSTPQIALLAVLYVIDLLAMRLLIPERRGAELT